MLMHRDGANLFVHDRRPGTGWRRPKVSHIDASRPGRSRYRRHQGAAVVMPCDAGNGRQRLPQLLVLLLRLLGGQRLSLAEGGLGRPAPFAAPLLDGEPGTQSDPILRIYGVVGAI